MALFSGGFSATSAEALHAMNNAGKGAPNNALRVALYLRVSTHDQQTLPLQLHAHAHRRGWQVVQEVAEVASGAAAVKRPKRDALLQAAKRREVDAILVWRLDRWGRSVADLVNSLAELEAVGVAFVSVTEALDLTTPAGRAMAAMVAVFAQFEREILKERVKAGIAQARAKGKAMGRPKTAALQAEQVRALYAQGVSQAAIARRLGVGRTSVRRLLAQTPLSQD
ncbi:MAG: recombinase family protein [Gemmatimonadaceae bacterium]